MNILYTFYNHLIKNSYKLHKQVPQPPLPRFIFNLIDGFSRDDRHDKKILHERERDNIVH